LASSEQALVLRTRARTHNNCVARDIVRIGDQLLFGYNVFIGLRKETSVSDVFGLYRLAAHDGEPELEALPLAGSFLEDARFASDFKELYAYYKQAQLLQLRVTQGKLLASFQIGQQVQDVRVFRWHIGGQMVPSSTWTTAASATLRCRPATTLSGHPPRAPTTWKGATRTSACWTRCLSRPWAVT
jgi:hypothetical protein